MMEAVSESCSVSVWITSDCSAPLKSSHRVELLSSVSGRAPIDGSYDPRIRGRLSYGHQCERVDWASCFAASGLGDGEKAPMPAASRRIQTVPQLRAPRQYRVLCGHFVRHVRTLGRE
jgi:hypothetical protein